MKFLIAGLGSIGRRHLRNLVALGQEDILLYRTHHSTLLEDELAAYPVETDLAAALAHHPDAVIVANPTALHMEVALPAARAGCHLLLEKPIADRADAQVELLRQTALENQVRILVGFQFRIIFGNEQQPADRAFHLVGRLHFLVRGLRLSPLAAKAGHFLKNLAFV